ncbi:MAG: transposase [Methanosarcinaceae archaeon]|nr:transposase [Methanosarcinaceae archaeon]
MHDAGWATLILHTTYKAAEKGKIVEKVDHKNTSHVCSVCGIKKKSKLQLSD